MKLKRNFALALLILLITARFPRGVNAKEKFWEIQSIDTMKYSRDLAREKLNDPLFSAVIENQVRNIAKTGATHVAIGTPYDSEFLPFMKKWLEIIRKYDMNVWFRGNFSGWERWFGYDEMTPDQHIRATESLIKNNDQLFENGDIFTSCTECENGAIGDPRNTGDVDGFRDFLIHEYKTSSEAFKSINKKVISNYFSMNGDVAMLVMDKNTTKSLNGVVAVDHYVKEPVQMIEDIRRISESSGGRIILGEFGAPIPDIHGELDENEQASWLEAFLGRLAFEDGIIGMNYWVAYGGTSAIWNSDSTGREASDVLTSYYSPEILSGRVEDEFGKAIKNAIVQSGSKNTDSDADGRFEIDYVPSVDSVIVSAKGYQEKVVAIENLGGKIDLEYINKGLLYKFKKLIYKLINKIS